MIALQKKTKESALELLFGNEQQNALMIKCVLQGRADDIELLGSSICFHDKSSGNYFYYSENIEQFDALYNNKKPKVFFLSSDVLLRSLERKYPEVIIHSYNQWLYTGKNEIRLKEFDFICFRKLELEDLPVIVGTQHSEEFKEVYFAEQIRSNTSICAVDIKSNEILGYFLMHKDGENGPLYVADKCRNMGLGTEMLIRITRDVLSFDKWPLGHVKPENKPATAISIKAGYELCPREILWCYAH